MNSKPVTENTEDQGPQSYYNKETFNSVNGLRDSCVMVRVQGNDKLNTNRTFSYKVGGKTIFSCSGFILDKERGIIITSSVIFLPFLVQADSNNQNMILNNIINTEKLHTDIQIEVLLNCNTNVDLEAIETTSSATTTQQNRIFDPLNNWNLCRFKKLLNCNDASMQILNKLKNNFTLVNSNVLNASLDLSFGFVVLEIVDKSLMKSYNHVTLGNSMETERGDPITVVGSPFGFVSPTMFLNSISSGVICNKIPPPNKQYSSPSLYLVDARCLPGNEGSAVFDRLNHLIGIIAPSIKSKNEKLPFTLTPVIPIHCLVKQFDQMQLSPKFSLNQSPYVPDTLTSIQNTIVLVQFKTSWGSGVLISDTGYLLTNAHLIIPSIPQLFELATSNPPMTGAFPPKYYKDYSVDIRVNNAAFYGSEAVKGYKWFRGSIEYISHTHLDIALIKIKDFHNYSTTMSHNSSSNLKPNAPLLSTNTVEDMSIRLHHVECRPLLNPSFGTNVAVLGYPLIPPTHNPPMSITRGVISNIVSVDGCAVSYQTTASVHSGNSGGGLFDLSGNWLGIVTCNAKQKNGSIITDLNFSIPASSLLPFFNYANQIDPLALENLKLTKTNRFLKALWKLQISPSPAATNQQQNKKSIELQSKL